MDKSEKRLRFVVIAIIVFSLFSLLIIQFYRIQVIDHEKWKLIAKSQHQTVVKEPFKRGIFYSNTSLKKGHPEQPLPFVVDVLRYHLFIDPTLIPERIKGEMAAQITDLLDLSGDITEHFGKKSRSRKIAVWLSASDKECVEKWWVPFARMHKIPRNSLYLVKDYQRSYPFGKMLAQVLHTVRDDRDIETEQAIPTGGLESMFHHYLKGKPGKRVILRSPKFGLDSNELQELPQDGADIYLTVNHCLQAICEEELMKGVKKVNAKSGFCVMMDPFTGEVLAIAHYPFFEPTQYREYYNDEEKLDLTRLKAVTDCFEPGSIMKPLTVAIALEANEELKRRGKKPLFNPHEMVRSDQSSFPGRSKPLTEITTHKYLNMSLAIQKSSNIYPARLVQKIIEELGPAWYREKIVAIFGLGSKTKIELPYENPGLIPTPGKLYANGLLEWSVPTPFSLAIGYNLLVNSIQISRAYSILANGGCLVQPTIIRKIVKNGEILYDGLAKNEVKRVLSPEIVAEVVKAMKYTTKPGGSCYLADIPGFTELGKSGTAEKVVGGKYSKSQNFASFIGFTPVEHPRFVLYVGIDEPEKKIVPGFGSTQFGGKCAAPVFREIAKRSLQYLGVTPDDPFGYPRNDPRSSAGKADWSNEVKELAELYNKWNRKD